MPSVGMRRSTRVFGARVLRSGRRVWTGPGGGEVRKHLRAEANGEEWVELLDHSGDGGPGGGEGIEFKENGWLSNDLDLKQEVTKIDIHEKLKELKSGKRVARPNVTEENSRCRMWGVVYERRKRKKRDSESNLDFLDDEEMKMRAEEDFRRYGKQFVRKQWRRKRTRESPPVAEKGTMEGKEFLEGPARCCGPMLAFVVESESSSSSSSWPSCLLNSVLSCVRRVRMRMELLSAFMSSEPIARVYSSHGIHFLQDPTTSRDVGVCKIWGVRCFIPLFVVDFSAIPFCFQYLHISLLLKSAFLFNTLVICSTGIDIEDEIMTDTEEHPSCISFEKDQSGSQTAASVHDSVGKNRVIRASIAAPKSSGRNVQLRNSVNSRSIQKRRSSLRLRRGRKPTVFGARKDKGALASNVFGIRHDRFPVPSCTRELRSSVRRSSRTNIEDLKSTLMGSKKGINSTSCSANLLIVEADKCYRDEGAIITLEISASEQWFLAVNKEGIKRYSLTAQKIMRPCSCNRFTHAIMWTGDNNWKLEFPNRRDWLIFKELYKECSDRNVKTPTASVIHVPGVREVFSFLESCGVPFMRPDSYITVNDDEVSRALTRRMANYDMDSDDENWLDKFNNACAENELHEKLLAENFELIIDAFEKGFYCGPDDYSDEKIATNHCLDLERREVLQAVHGYWMKKRKQKRSALVRIFQCYLPRRTQLIPKSILRKKRSFKRQASQVARGKQRTFFQAVATKQDAQEEQNIFNKVQEAKAAASRSEEFAVLKRQRAQLLMENADLATYKGTMALRIAEALQGAKASDAADSFFLS
ncbi:unnamed protein product [Ilex paraguariensis]|uniref:Enhancer of polycomb-like protein n=1 Tax=Ilex paraguariensis TaxID=185542 RepID=A0ABC8TWS7_9AQUA